MSIQSEFGKTLGVAATAASIAKGFSTAKAKEEKAEEQEYMKAQKEAEAKAEAMAKANKGKELREALIATEAEREKKAKEMQERQDLTFMEVSQNKIEAQRKAMKTIEGEMAKIDPEIAKRQRRANSLNNLRNKGGMKGEEARASLEDALSQQATLKRDWETRKKLMEQRIAMVEQLQNRKEIEDGEE